MKTIKIYDDIDSFWGYGLESLEADLKEANGEDVHVKIQSGGGSVFEGLAIYNTLKNYEGEVTTEIVGISASIASIIFLAGSKRIVNEVGFLMIHQAWTMSVGGADDLREDADLLDQINSQILDIYENVTGFDREELKEKMSKDTYMGPDELKELGFVTEVKEGVQIAASINNFKMNSLKQTPKEKTMAMTKEEKAEFDALKAENLTLKEAQAKLVSDKDAEIETIKAEQDERVSLALKAEKDREKEIMASILHPKQEAFAKELVAKGEEVVNAKLAIMDDLRANKESYLKAESESQVNSLEKQAPNATKHEEETFDHATKWRSIENIQEKQEYFAKYKEQIKGAL